VVALWHHLIVLRNIRKGTNLLACVIFIGKIVLVVLLRVLLFSFRINVTVLKQLSLFGKGRITGGTWREFLCKLF